MVLGGPEEHSAPHGDAAYPAEWETDVVLADGGTAHVRPIRPDDADRLVAMHGRLSPQSIYYRFFSPHPRLTPAEVAHFTTVDYVDRLALVLLLGDEIIGVARYDRPPGTDEAEVAFVVDDAHQRRGIATLLLEHLAIAATERGIARFTAVTLPDNRGMGTVFRQAGFNAKAGFADGVVEFTMVLDASPETVAMIVERERRADSRSVDPVLHPRSVAVIGASADRESVGYAIVRNLVVNGFTGPVYPVNPNRSSVSGLPAFAAIAEVPDRVDLAVIALPAAKVLDAVRECASRRVRAVLVLSAGFDAEGARELADTARRLGMRLVGPSSLGVLTPGPETSMIATFAPIAPRPGGAALVVQSGTLGAALVQRATRLGLGFSHVVSLGDKADVSANDLLQHWATEGPSVVLLYGESFGNPRKFTRIVRSVASRVPVVATAPGGATAEDDALFRQLGVLRVGTIEELLDVARLVDGAVLPAGDRVAVITDAESPGLLSAAAAEAAGLEVTVVRDLGFDARPEDYAAAAREACADADMLVVVHAPALHGDPEQIATVVRAEAGHVPAVMVAVTERADATSLPTFHFPESAALALGRLAEHARWLRRDAREPEPLGVDAGRARALVDRVLDDAPGGRTLRWDELAQLLGAAGVSVAESRVVTDVEQAVAAATAVGYPVAIKAMRLAHLGRSEAGGVALDLHTEEALRESYERMTALVGAGMDEALVQRMVPPGVEVMVDVHEHRLFGPVVSVGIGGVLADHLGARPRRAVPLTMDDVDGLVEDAPVGAALRDRGVGREPLADLVARVAWLADAVPELRLLRLNPVLVSEADMSLVGGRCALAPHHEHVLPMRRLG